MPNEHKKSFVLYFDAYPSIQVLPVEQKGMLLTLLLDSYRARWHWLSWAGCTLYAATDEIHQLFVAGRTGKWQDVLLDSSGALAGLLLAMFMLWLIRRRRAKKQST